MGPCPYILCGVTALCVMELLMNQGLKFEAGAETRVLHAWTSVIKTEVAGSWVVTASELAAAMSIFLPLEFRAAAILDGLVQRVFAEVRSFLDREGACVAMALNWAMLPSPQPNTVYFLRTYLPDYANRTSHDQEIKKPGRMKKRGDAVLAAMWPHLSEEDLDAIGEKSSWGRGFDLNTGRKKVDAGTGPIFHPATLAEKARAAEMAAALAADVKQASVVACLNSLQKGVEILLAEGLEMQSAAKRKAMEAPTMGSQAMRKRRMAGIVKEWQTVKQTNQLSSWLSPG